MQTKHGKRHFLLDVAQFLHGPHSKNRKVFSILSFSFLQLGPQQLKYMTFLKDSSDSVAFSSCILLETTAEEEEESFFACENDPTWLFTLCWADLKPEFHLQRPWSFKASTTPTPTNTVQALLGELISSSSYSDSLSYGSVSQYVSEEYKHKILNDEISKWRVLIYRMQKSVTERRCHFSKSK